MSPGCSVAGDQAQGGPQAPAARAGDVPLGGGPMFGLLGALGLELVALHPGWELSTTTWARPHPALGFLQGRVSVRCWRLGRASGLGALEVAPAAVPSVHLPQSDFQSLFTEEN